MPNNFLLQKLEYFTKILRLIMSLHRDIMELQLQCSQDIVDPQPFRVPPKIKAEITMKWHQDRMRYTVSVEVPRTGNRNDEGEFNCDELDIWLK